MNLSNFLKSLFEQGEVSIDSNMEELKAEDEESALSILNQRYEKDILEMPHKAPTFSPKAAIWGATFIYRTTQLLMLRNLPASDVEKYLTDFQDNISHEAIYSIDLSLRYIVDLFKLGKGLAPDDVLLLKLKEIAQKWPFSSVGIDIEANKMEELLFSHPSLKYAYIDRILAVKDKKRAKSERVEVLIKEVAGAHLAEIWN